MRILLTIIIFATIMVSNCVAQVEYIYSDIRCEKEKEITSKLYSIDRSQTQLWIDMLYEAENAVEQEPDLQKQTGSLVRIYQMFDIINNQEGKNRCLQKMHDLAETSGDNEIFVRAKILQAHSMIRSKEIKAAITCYQDAIKYLEPQKAYAQIAKLHCFLGYAYESFNNEALCIHNILEAVTIAENECSDNPLLMGEVYLHTAIIYLNQADYVKADGYITGALTIFNLNKESENKMYRNFYNTTLIVAAEIKRATEKRDTAIMLYDMGIKGFKETTFDNSARNSLKYLSDGHNGLGITYQQIGNDTAAINHMMEALQIRKNLGQMDKIADSYITIAEYYTHKKMLDSALYYNIEGFNLAQDIKDNRLMSRSADNLAKYYAKKDDYKRAYKYSNIAHDARTAISDTKIIKEVTREEMDYMFDQE
ncbi:MAG: hypothetical protein J5595_07085, partial [Bacteroidales bacterium]|nr:hypothetical protein [Bacteroidales bacterium]